jgi:hypothetical protein
MHDHLDIWKTENDVSGRTDDGLDEYLASLGIDPASCGRASDADVERVMQRCFPRDDRLHIGGPRLDVASAASSRLVAACQRHPLGLAHFVVTCVCATAAVMLVLKVNAMERLMGESTMAIARATSSSTLGAGSRSLPDDMTAALQWEMTSGSVTQESTFPRLSDARVRSTSELPVRSIMARPHPELTLATGSNSPRALTTASVSSSVVFAMDDCSVFRRLDASATPTRIAWEPATAMIDSCGDEPLGKCLPHVASRDPAVALASQ